MSLGVGLGEERGESLGEGGLVGNWVIFTLSGSFSFLGGWAFCSDGIGIASNKPCKPSEISSIGRTQNCKGAGKFFKK